MSTITDKTSPNTPAPQPWLKPSLLDYGAVEDLTQGGSGGSFLGEDVVYNSVV